MKDYYQLATMPTEFAERSCVQLLSARMQRYLDGVADRHRVMLGVSPGTQARLDPVAIAGLPGTALKALTRWNHELPPISARCIAAHQVGPDLHLVAHAVEPVSHQPGGP